MRKIYPCEKKYKEKRRQDFKRLVDELKNRPCADCHKKYDPCVMDFDHIDPNKKESNVGKLIRNGSLQRLISEIEKCEIVCANCQRMRTKRQHEKGMFFVGFKKTDESQLKLL